ncbi:MAG: tetratricopeptide repeat protein [Candidatus Aminicenantes bacterium]|nr:tetratricopeptide repeat protein [Candidatus Aminicenantes bacterium]
MYLANTIKYLSVFCLILVILVIPGAISAQATERVKVKLEGTVLNIDKEPILKAEIQLKHEDSSQIFYYKSNKKGEFSSSFIPPGNYTLKVKKEGYKSYTGELQLRPNIIQKLEIILAKEETLEQKLEKEAVSSFKKGVKLAQENKLDEATQTFHKAIDLKPDFAEAYVNIGILLFQQQKDDEAEKALLKALELKPEESKCKEILADINFEKAKILIQADKVDEALEKLKQAYSFHPGHAYVNYLLGHLYFKKEMKDEAIKHFEAFLQLEPNALQVEEVKRLLKSLKKRGSKSF